MGLAGNTLVLMTALPSPPSQGQDASDALLLGRLREGDDAAEHFGRQGIGSTRSTRPGAS